MNNYLKDTFSSFVGIVKGNPKTSLTFAITLLLGLVIRKQQRRIIYIPCKYIKSFRNSWHG